MKNYLFLIKKLLILAIYTTVFYFFFIGQAALAASLSDLANNTLLPSPFMVYTDGKTVINHPYGKFVKKEMPINNDYQTNPGCYLACYSHDHKQSIYSAGNKIYVLGLVRVPGQYQKGICKSDDSQAKYNSKTMCNDTFTECNNACWSGGDTGGFFGIR